MAAACGIGAIIGAGFMALVFGGIGSLVCSTGMADKGTASGW